MVIKYIWLDSSVCGTQHKELLSMTIFLWTKNVNLRLVQRTRNYFDISLIKSMGLVQISANNMKNVLRCCGMLSRQSHSNTAIMSLWWNSSDVTWPLRPTHMDVTVKCHSLRKVVLTRKKYSSNFTPQMKQARNQSQIFHRKSISSNTTYHQPYICKHTKPQKTNFVDVILNKPVAENISRCLNICTNWNFTLKPQLGWGPRASYN